MGAVFARPRGGRELVGLIDVGVSRHTPSPYLENPDMVLPRDRRMAAVLRALLMVGVLLLGFGVLLLLGVGMA